MLWRTSKRDGTLGSRSGTETSADTRKPSSAASLAVGGNRVGLDAGPGGAGNAGGCGSGSRVSTTVWTSMAKVTSGPLVQVLMSGCSWVMCADHSKTRARPAWMSSSSPRRPVPANETSASPGGKLIEPTLTPPGAKPKPAVTVCIAEAVNCSRCCTRRRARSGSRASRRRDADRPVTRTAIGASGCCAAPTCMTTRRPTAAPSQTWRPFASR